MKVLPFFFLFSLVLASGCTQHSPGKSSSDIGMTAGMPRGSRFAEYPIEMSVNRTYVANYIGDHPLFLPANRTTVVPWELVGRNLTSQVHVNVTWTFRNASPSIDVMAPTEFDLPKGNSTIHFEVSLTPSNETAPHYLAPELVKTPSVTSRADVLPCQLADSAQS